MIANGYFWTNIILLTIGTFIIRASFIATSAKVQISERHREIFSFIPAAILPALAVPLVFYHQGQVQALLGKERFFILILATVVAFYSKKMTFTLIFGLSSLYLLIKVFQ